MVLFDVLRERDVDVTSQERVILGLDEVFVVLFHRLSQFGVRDGVRFLYAVQVFYLLVEALEKYNAIVNGAASKQWNQAMLSRCSKLKSGG